MKSDVEKQILPNIIYLDGTLKQTSPNTLNVCENFCTSYGINGKKWRAKYGFCFKLSYKDAFKIKLSSKLLTIPIPKLLTKPYIEFFGYKIQKKNKSSDKFLLKAKRN